MRALKILSATAMATALLACGGGGGGGGGSAATSTYTVSGSISGLLANRSVVLEDNGANATTFTANGNYAYTGAIATGTAYAITVKTQPVGETCTVTNGSGTVSSANVTNVTVSCTPNTYTVTANVSGLIGGQSLVLKLNGASATQVNSTGAYTFAAPVASGSSYAVTVSTQPVGQSCIITNGSGTMLASNVSNVQVNCIATSYNLSVNLTGLPYGASITLMNGTDSLQLTNNGTANFPTPVTYDSTYNVTVSTPPANLSCNVTSPTGTVTGPVTVAVDCPHFAYVDNDMSSDISIFSVDNNTGALTPVGTPVSTTTTLPYGIAINPNLGFVYLPNAGGTGIFGFAVNTNTGALSTINGGAAYPSGVQPWCMTFNASGTVAFATNYSDNTISSFTVNPATGDLTAAATSAVPTLPTASNPFGVVVAPNANFVYSANDNSDSVSVFQFDATTGALSEITGSPFAVGDVDPVMAIDPSGSFAYVLGATQGLVYGFTIDGTGALTPITGSPWAAGTPNPSGIAIHPNGKFVYVVNYNNPGGTVSVYAITPVTGVLTQVGSPVAAGNGAESITIDPTAQFAYVTNQIDNTINAYTIDGTTGALTPIATTSPIATGTKPELIVFH